MKTFFKWLAGILVILALIAGGFLLLINSLFKNEVSVYHNSYLDITLSGTLPEYVAPDPLGEALGRTSLDMRQVRENLEKARIDKRINGVLLEIGMLQTGYAKIQELRHLISVFRKSGKKIYAYLGPDIAMTKDYYVATACDSIFMPPPANLFITGVHSELTFYKKFLDKLGIQAEFIQIGKYKNAPDIYTRKSMAPAQRSVLKNIIGQFYKDLVQTLAESRHLSKQKVQKIINDQSGFSGREALKAGLVDGLLYTSFLRRKFNIGQGKVHKISGADYAQVPVSSLKIRNKSRIAVINCNGVITSGDDSQQPYFGKMLGAHTVISNLKRVSASKFIKAIILRIDSPGGSATASDQIWQAIQEAKKHKPVIASVSDYGASGGYYIAMAADTIVVTPNSLVGSIGIFAGKFNVAGLYKKLGLKYENVGMGKNAHLFSIMQPWSKNEKSIMSRLIKEFYLDFVTKTARARELSFAQVDSLGQGHIWSGAQAVKNGLSDTSGFFYSAVALAKKMASIPQSESVRLVYYPRKKSLLGQILNDLSAKIFQNDFINATQSERFLNTLRRLQNRPLALLPFKINWN